MNIVYAQTEFPSNIKKSIFLAGPTPRGKHDGWRGEALSILRDLGFDGHVFVPESENGIFNEDYVAQIEWEEEGLNRADCIAFWIPRDVTGDKFFGYPMPGFTTNDEWGFWKASDKVVLGVVSGADHIKYQLYYAKKYRIPTSYTLKETLQSAIDMAEKSTNPHLNSSRFTFRIDPEEHSRVIDFLNAHSHRGVYFGAIGGHISFTFCSTSIGIITSVKCSKCNEKIDASGRL